jgi:transcriptional regulator with XRE-family HTH domain
MVCVPARVSYEPDESPLGGYPVPGLIRAARRRADWSQAELAKASRIHKATVGRIEARQLVPSLRLFVHLLATAGFDLIVVDKHAQVLQPMRDREDLRDGAERRYPSHLDVITDPKPGEWWADVYGLTRPPETFYRDREQRDRRRRRSQWEVRVAKYRHDPEPPDVPYR